MELKLKSRLIHGRDLICCFVDARTIQLILGFAPEINVANLNHKKNYAKFALLGLDRDKSLSFQYSFHSMHAKSDLDPLKIRQYHHRKWIFTIFHLKK